MKRPQYYLLLLILPILRIPAEAEVSLPPIFSEHAVLQRAEKVPVWGKAASGERVTVTLAEKSGVATADASGKWSVSLDLRATGNGPFELTVEGGNKITISDVLIGEVWACTGQSNMAFPLSAFANLAKEELPTSDNANLRQFLVKFKASPVPLEEADGQWTVASPKTAGAFTAVGYFFGKQLQKELGVPVGLINDSVGGTCIEAWMSQEALDGDALLKEGRIKAQNERAAFDSYAEKYKSWQKKYNREDHPANGEAYYGKDVNTNDWKMVELPGLFLEAGLADAGAVWIRKKIPVPSAPDIQVNKGIDLYLGNVRDTNVVYWNDRKIGESDFTSVLRRYGIRFNFVTEGENTLAVRIFNAAGGAGILPGKERFQGNHYMLKGEWLAKTEFSLPPLSPEAKADLPTLPPLPIDSQNVASYLYNGMIHPIIPYAVRGFIWYQGEGNWNRGFQYRTAFPLMIRDWRQKWGRGDLPFYFCQIANYMGHSTKPEESPYAEVREAQTMTLKEPNTGQAILIDIGEEGNIHPADKPSVGQRLARIAMAKNYDKKVSYSGPVYKSMQIEGNKARLTFDHADQGLIAKPMPGEYRPVSTETKSVALIRNSPSSELEGFAICGEDKKWSWAQAKIEGNSVVVWSDEVPQPIGVRYAWAQNPFCNLYSSAGLPAGPFRTDDFAIGSKDARY